MHVSKGFILLSIVLVLPILAGCTATDSGNNSDTKTIRVGYFPNITHAQALVGLADGTFQAELGEDVTIEPYTFNAGPAAIEALFADQIDLAYIGPSPALNGFVQSNGEALRMIAGSMAGGAALVVQPEVAEAYRTQGDSAFVGKTLASPQQGNTQDVALRSYLQERDLLEQVTISPMANADQLSLFQQKQLDGAWAPEPWASRLVAEAGGELLVDDVATTTIVIVSTEFLQEHADLVEHWLAGHVAVTEWINAHPSEAQTLVNQEIETLTGARLDDAVLAAAWTRLHPTTDANQPNIETFQQQAEALGFIQTAGLDMASIYDFTIISRLTR